MGLKKNLLGTGMGIIILGFLVPFMPLITESMHGENWRYLIEDKKTLTACYNSIFIAFSALGINIILGTPAAAVLGRKKFKGKKAIELLILLPLIIPSFVTTMGIQYTFVKLGIIETFAGVATIHSVVTLPYYINSLKAGYSTLRIEYEYMGKILGAGKLKRFTHITLPYLFPSIAAGSSLVLIVSFAQYLTTLIIGGGEVITLPILMFPYISGGDVKMGAVYSIVYAGMNLFLVLFVEKGIKKVYGRN